MPDLAENTKRQGKNVTGAKLGTSTHKKDTKQDTTATFLCVLLIFSSFQGIKPKLKHTNPQELYLFIFFKFAEYDSSITYM